MAHDTCDPKDKWPRRNDCDLKNIRARRSGLGVVFRAASDGVKTLFRRGLPVPESFRPAFHCEPQPEFVLAPVYNEHRQLVYNEAGVQVFAEVRIV